MNYIDIIVLIIIILLSLRGFINGFIYEILSIVGLVLGAYLGATYGKDVGILFDKHALHFTSAFVVNAIGFAIVFLVVWIVCLFIGIFISRFTLVPSLSFLNKILGFLFGLVKNFVILSLIVFGISYTPFFMNFAKKAEKNSATFELMIQTGGGILRHAWLLDEIKKVDLKNAKNLQDSINSTTKAIQHKLNKTVQDLGDHSKDAIDSTVNHNLDEVIDKVKDKVENPNSTLMNTNTEPNTQDK
ncbi:CvpA family protein [Helicobacter sp. 11S02629-2]|uniref:CvpA family protein n=1 Tax=Helicobacter sp. 11S02629-2 TaxID=1476195 RepID=UPI000BA77DBA|nr:CvpA family protein [Helicobacter sp. 11S02629-2]PAF45507.1 hypothetical protein BKH40_03340 [Helicobacter sp. 11S02629-2]